MVMTRRKDAVPDKVTDYRLYGRGNEAIALYPANLTEEGFYIYI